MKPEETEPLQPGVEKPAGTQKRALFERQKTLLDTFLATRAISPAQYRKSLTCLAEKMGFGGHADCSAVADPDDVARKAVTKLGIQEHSNQGTETQETKK